MECRLINTRTTLLLHACEIEHQENEQTICCTVIYSTGLQNYKQRLSSSINNKFLPRTTTAETWDHQPHHRVTRCSWVMQRHYSFTRAPQCPAANHQWHDVDMTSQWTGRVWSAMLRHALQGWWRHRTAHLWLTISSCCYLYTQARAWHTQDTR